MLNYNLIGDNDYIFDPQGTILANRGIDDIDAFMNLNEDVKNDYRLLKNIDKAVDCLLSHIANKSKMLIIVDPDVDGYTSSTIMYQYLKSYDDKINLNWVLHNDKKHGIDGIEIPNDINLLIVPDSGSNDFDHHRKLFDKGIDVIVLDHHEIERESEYAIVVNSHLGDFPNLNLSGAGIVIKFCEALDDSLGLSLSDNFYDLVALGNIGDSMSMKELETRYYVQIGLNEINNDFFNSLLRKQEYSTGGRLNITNISFYICPLINAVIRVAPLKDKIDMFKSFIGVKELVKYKPRGIDKETLVPLVDDMARRCSNIKAKQARMTDKAVTSIGEYVNENKLYDNKIIFIHDIEEVDEGITGLICMKIATMFKRPTIILSKKDERGYYRGSARGYDKSELKDFKDITLKSELFSYAKGHKQAYGVEIHKDNFSLVNETLNNLLVNYDFSDIYTLDFELKSNSLSGQLIHDICDLQDLWCKGIDEPHILIKGIEVSSNNVNLMGKAQNTISIEDNGIKYIIFKTNEDAYNKIVSSKHIDIIGRANLNTYEGKTSPQIISDDYYCY